MRRPAIVLLALVIVGFALGGLGGAFAGTQAGDVASMRASYGALRDQFAGSPFGRPLHVDSVEGRQSVSGVLYGVVAQPYATVLAELRAAGPWCDVLILHLNVKFCRATSSSDAELLTLYVGTKVDQPIAGAFHVHYRYRLVSATPEYLRIELTADAGPYGTSDYRISVEAIATDDGLSFVRLSYAYSYGALARFAMNAYLATAGRGKIGFTVVDRRRSGEPVYVDGMRGVVERNVMRYYLAVVSYLGALTAAPQDRLETRLHDWFAATETYAPQLHEIDEASYLTMKRHEVRRQQAGR